MSTRLRAGHPVRRPEVWLRQSEDENAIYDPVSGEVHLLNATALAIWVLCDGETTPAEMIDAVCELSGLPHDVVTEDVSRILTQFEDAGIMGWKG